MKLCIARHGQTDWNAQHRVQGRADTWLNDTGRRQAADLGKKLAERGIIHIAASTLHRARETALIIRSHAPVSVSYDARLIECSFGTLEGLDWLEFRKRCGWDVLPKSEYRSYDFRPFGGECFDQVWTRQKESLDELKTAHGHGPIALIGHGRSLRTLLVALGHTERVADQGHYLEIEY